MTVKINKQALKNYQEKYGSDSILNVNKGLEKEGLRVMVEDGKLSSSDHDPKFGSKLLHKWITTDFAESLLEFITPVSKSNDETLKTLGNLQHYVLEQDSSEVIWPSSMPCILPEDKDIKLAYYGESNSGRLKTLYRSGLGLRYGRSMQAIAGLHYNFSMTDEFWKNWHELSGSSLSLQLFINEEYLNLCRNFRSYSNILLYLFGNSVSVHESFLSGKKHSLDVIHEDEKYGKTFGSKEGTCLRMGGLGYTGASQNGIRICYNGLDSYCDSLEEALQMNFADFDKIGLRNEKGELQQISTHILQIENEFYSIIRPKRIAPPGKSALASLRSKGIEYIEVRLLDLNPFAKNGITKVQMDFLDAFLLSCLFLRADRCNREIYNEIENNNQLIVKQGRKPGLEISVDGEKRNYQEYLTTFFNQMAEVIEAISDGERKKALLFAIEEQRKLIDPANTLSQKVFDLVSKKGHIQAMKDLALEHRKELAAVEVNHVFQEELELEKNASMQRQVDFEKLDDVDFEEYVAAYVASSFSK
ncbi:glutamate--cysteine ligase [Halobacteriovorax sp. DA5]|uniref:glutamate--cysteine ligase n=1 Tax=Halobacteriovorax sp. DA5 TaxID=2067553 RepID=UPI00130480F9|nr:glutamate--cysteine ligase [Halobacteriovorax sp. DA5]